MKIPTFRLCVWPVRVRRLGGIPWAFRVECHCMDSINGCGYWLKARHGELAKFSENRRVVGMLPSKWIPVQIKACTGGQKGSHLWPWVVHTTASVKPHATWAGQCRNNDDKVSKYSNWSFFAVSRSGAIFVVNLWSRYSFILFLNTQVLIDCSGPLGEPRNEETGMARKRDALLSQLERRMALRTLVFCNTIQGCRQASCVFAFVVRRHIMTPSTAVKWHSY